MQSNGFPDNVQIDYQKKNMDYIMIDTPDQNYVDLLSGKGPELLKKEFGAYKKTFRPFALNAETFSSQPEMILFQTHRSMDFSERIG